MKVLHLINTLSAGGAELHLLTLCRHLKRQGEEMVVAFLREQVRGSRSLRADFEQAGIRVIDLKAGSRYSWQFLARLPFLLKRERFDLLHTHLPRADLAGAVAKFIFPGIPWVSSVHGMYRTWTGNRILFLFNRIWQRPEKIIAISYAVRNWLCQDRGIPLEKVAVIYYGIEPETFWGIGDKDRRNYQPIIGTIGRLDVEKGHQVLIKAMPMILKQVPRAQLLIAGYDPNGYGQHLQELIKNSGLEQQVQLMGFQRDIPRFLHSIDVFAFASFSEGFGQVLTEAMAAGKPVVASNISPLTEIVQAGRTGYLAEINNPQAFADHIISLLLRPEEAKRMGKAGAKRVKKLFSAERMTDETVLLYERLLN